MERYENLSGDSGVTAYENRRGAIVIEFVNGSVHRYTNRSAGARRRLRKCSASLAGRGLSTYTSQSHPLYERRLH